MGFLKMLSVLNKVGKVARDVNAIKKGKVKQRIKNRVKSKLLNKSGFWRW